MEISQEFALRVSRIKHNRNQLLQLMEALDLEKRNLKARQQKFSSMNKENGGLSGQHRMNELRRLKLKMEHLKTERAYVQQQLRALNVASRGLARARSHRAGFCEAMVAAAQEQLTEEQMIELELRAVQLLEIEA